MQQPLAHARIPHDWDNQLRAIAQETGKSYSEVVREAIAAYLDKVEPDSVQTMNRRIAQLERQVKKLANVALS